LKAALLALLVLALAACAGFPERRDSADDTADGAAQPTADAEQDAAAAPDADEPAPIPPSPNAKPDRPAVTGDDLIGLTTAQAWELLADPSTTKKESPATVWAYEHAGCRLELFFYFDLESQEQRTLAFDLDPGADSVGGESFCLQEIARRGQGANAPGTTSESEAAAGAVSAAPGTAAAATGEPAGGTATPGNEAGEETTE